MTYYHISRVKLSDDTKVLVPDYYNRIATHGLKDEYFNQFWKEMIFERVRRNHFPEKVSRFNCVFLVDSIDMAKQYMKDHEYAANGTIYEVLPKPNALINKFDMKLLEINWESDQNIYNQARMYFGGCRTSNVFWEVLHEGPVEILNIVE